MVYQVFLVVSPGMPMDHHAIFVETSADGSGQIFQATGNIQMGMRYETKPGKKPEDDPAFISKESLGVVAEANYERLKDICGRVPPPKKQFQGAKRLFPGEPLRRCQEWAREAVDALKTQDIIQ